MGIYQTALTPGSTASVALSGATADTDPFAKTATVRLLASDDGAMVIIGPSGLDPATDGFPLSAGIPEYFIVPQGDVISATGAGTLYVTEMV